MFDYFYLNLEMIQIWNERNDLMDKELEFEYGVYLLGILSLDLDDFIDCQLLTFEEFKKNKTNV